MSINYERAKRNGPKLKAALTRATKMTDPTQRKDAVLIACARAVQEWDVWGAWPDNWSYWQRALSDALLAARRADAFYYTSHTDIKLEDLR
jgi:hypothetical protein